MLFLVNFHMRAHNDFQSSKAQKKYRELFGDERFNLLMAFGECDRKATGTHVEEFFYSSSFDPFKAVFHIGRYK